MDAVGPQSAPGLCGATCSPMAQQGVITNWVLLNRMGIRRALVCHLNLLPESPSTAALVMSDPSADIETCTLALCTMHLCRSPIITALSRVL